MPSWSELPLVWTKGVSSASPWCSVWRPSCVFPLVASVNPFPESSFECYFSFTFPRSLSLSLFFKDPALLRAFIPQMEVVHVNCGNQEGFISWEWQGLPMMTWCLWKMLESVWWGGGEDAQAPSELPGEGKGCRWVDGVSIVPSPFPLSSQCPFPHIPHFLFW